MLELCSVLMVIIHMKVMELVRYRYGQNANLAVRQKQPSRKLWCFLPLQYVVQFIIIQPTSAWPYNFFWLCV